MIFLPLKLFRVKETISQQEGGTTQFGIYNTFIPSL